MKKAKATKTANSKKKTAAVREVYRTPKGRMLVGRVEDALDCAAIKRLRGKVNLIFTSPPFPLVRKKRYGNETGEQYLRWLESLAPRLCDLLTTNGSIVIEIGNSWEPGAPVMSTLGLEALLAFKKAGKLHLCQHVICHNPARLPSPAQWVGTRTGDSEVDRPDARAGSRGRGCRPRFQGPAAAENYSPAGVLDPPGRHAGSAYGRSKIGPKLLLAFPPACEQKENKRLASSTGRV